MTGFSVNVNNLNKNSTNFNIYVLCKIDYYIFLIFKVVYS